jgi:hypothetical protein
LRNLRTVRAGALADDDREFPVNERIEIDFLAGGDRAANESIQEGAATVAQRGRRRGNARDNSSGVFSGDDSPPPFDGGSHWPAVLAETRRTVIV